MKKIFIYMLFGFVLLQQKVYSQACGGGILTFKIYTLNGTETDKFSYEILPVSKELLLKNLAMV